MRTVKNLKGYTPEEFALIKQAAKDVKDYPKEKLRTKQQIELLMQLDAELANFNAYKAPHEFRAQTLALVMHQFHFEEGFAVLRNALLKVCANMITIVQQHNQSNHFLINETNENVKVLLAFTETINFCLDEKLFIDIQHIN
jgi:hypothetical protein